MVIKWVPPSRGTWLVEETTLECKRHSRLSLIVIVEACCTSNNANQCPGRYMWGKEKGESKWCVWRSIRFQTHAFLDASLPTGYLLLNSANLGRGTEGICTFHSSPSNFVSKNIFWDITFLPRSTHYQANSSKTRSPLPVCIGLDSVGVLLPGCIPLIPERDVIPNTIIGVRSWISSCQLLQLLFYHTFVFSM